MRILFVTTLKKDIVKVWLCQQTSAYGSLIAPVDLVSIAGVLAEGGHSVRIADLRLYQDPLEAYKIALREFNPEALVINLATASAHYDYQIIKNTPAAIKKIAFGSHAIALPEEAFQNGFDYVLYGDPEKAAQVLVSHNMDARGISGVSVPGSINKTPALFENLDSLPYLNLGLLELSRYSAPYTDKNTFFSAMLSSRGCPFECTYCLNPGFFGRGYRAQSPQRIAQELQFLQRRFGVGQVLFLDATFNVHESYVMSFCEELLKRDIRMKWFCNMRATPVSSEMLALMKKAGCKRVMYGVEDIELLEGIKKNAAGSEIFDAFSKSRKAGLLADAYVMLFPESRHKNELQYARYMLRLLKQLHADAFQCNIAIPFPGSVLFEHSWAPGTLSRNWALYDPGGRSQPYSSRLNLVKVKRIIIALYPFINFRSILRVLKGMKLKGFIGLIRAYLANIVNAKSDVSGG